MAATLTPPPAAALAGPLILLLAACGDDPGHEGADAAAPPDRGDAPGSAGGADAPTETDACPDLFRAFTLERLDSHSNVCVDRAQCTFTRLDPDACAASVTCEYHLAGAITADVEFHARGSVWTAAFFAGSRTHEFVARAGDPLTLSYRVRGDISDRHLCVFSDGDAAPIFPKVGAGACPDLTRAFRLSRLAPHSCSNTLRCGVFQSAESSCTVDAFCTYPTGTTESFLAVNVSRSPDGTRGVIVGDATKDPSFPQRYELAAAGDFQSGTGGVARLDVDYHFNDSASPTCRWTTPSP